MSTRILKKQLTLLMVLVFTVSVYGQSIVNNAEVYTGKADITATQQVILKPGFRAVAGSDVHAYIDGSATYTPNNYTIPQTGTMTTPVPTSGNNYVWTTTLREGTADESQIGNKLRIETVSYFDGLGRSVQNITVQGSPLKKDIVQATGYDSYGRQNMSYLSYVSSTGTGAYVSNPQTACENFYSSGLPGRATASNPWNETLYEASPLSRVEGGKGPDAWQNKPTVVSYGTNTGTIQHWNADKTSFSFGAGQLYVTTYTDEDGNQTREYKDKLGRVVRKEANDGTNWLRTAYVYDDFGNLVVVVPPKATSVNDTELCYCYEYDERKRMIKKELPGAAPVYMVYDKRDRLVMTQDGNQTAAGDWMFTKYDALNRPVYSGIINISKTQQQAADDFENFSGTMYESLSGSIFGYSGVSFPATYNALITEDEVNTVTYYDGYSFTSDAVYDISTYPLAGYATSGSPKTKGLLTGTLTRVLLNGTDGVNDELLLTVNYYDDFGRPIRVVADNHMGEQDVVYNNYDFTGQVTESLTRHNVSGSSQDVKLCTTFSYDHQGRLLAEKLEIDDSGSPITLSANKYNELGEVVAKYLHGDAGGNNFNQEVNYTYNVKGWLRTMNTVNNLGNDLFALDLRYNSPGTSDQLSANALYNGNITEMRWDAGTPKGYGFTYDGANRLKTADYAEGASFTSNQNYYNANFTYDENGNIDLLNRYKGAQIDNLDYAYLSSEKSNQIQSVNDATGNPAGYDDNNGTYTYDNNGNLEYDPSKGTNIYYNYLNLPSEVSFGANDKLRYTYSAAGNKLTRVVNGTVAENNTRIDYAGNFLYENNDLKAIFTSAGRVTPFDNNGNVLYRFEYNLQDHLGNTRVVFGGHGNGQPEIMQVTDYYPFGMVMEQENTFANGILANKYLYNNKELQDDELAGAKLDWYDYGARFYDPQLGRFHSVDPLAEEYNNFSPYNYVANNPIKLIDPDGRSMTDFYDKDNNFLFHIEDGSNAKFKLTGDSRSEEYFEFTGYDEKQGGENKVNTESAIKGAQDYTRENYTSVIDKDGKATETYCNYGTMNIAKTYESAVEATGKTVDISDIKGSARTIGGNLSKSEVVKPAENTSAAQKAAKAGSFVVGYWPGHVFTLNKKGQINNVGAPRPKNNVFDPKYTETTGQKFYIIPVK